MLQATILLGALVASVAGDCDCINIKECKQAMEHVQHENNETVKLVKKALCGWDENLTIKVCCSEFNITSRFQGDGVDDIENHRNQHLLPRDCGNKTTPRIYNGKKALPHEFPWLALISYKIDKRKTKQQSKIHFKCGGTVINELYVLTAAHCIKGEEETIVGVRIGEHIITEIKDCYEKESVSCELKHQDIAVEKPIYHSEFKKFPRSINDIGLLRLRSAVDFSLRNAGIICLPILRKFREMNITNKNATVAGWGATEEKTQSEILLKVDIPIISRNECYVHYNWQDKPLLENTLCAMGDGHDSCPGDSGGPLMLFQKFKERARFVQFGIVSYGYKDCGENKPGVYTDVRKYMKWILDKIEP